MLTKRQNQIHKFINEYTGRHEVSPTIQEIANRFHLSVSTVHEHLQAIEKKGYLKKDHGHARTIETIHPNKSGSIKIQLLGTIAAGQPIEAITENETISVPKGKFPNSTNIYALRVIGNSMTDENINDGDIILVRHQATAENGQKVVALIDNYQATLKKYYREKSHIRLQPANEAYEPIIIRNGKDIAIQGVVLDILKDHPTFSISHPQQKNLEYKKLSLNKIIHGDALKELKKIPDQSIDLILTDPPYGLNKTGIKNDGDLSLFYASLADSYRILKDNTFYITFFSTKFLPKIFENNPFKYFWNFVLYCPNGKVGSPIGYSKYMSCTVFKKGEAKMTKRNKDIFVDTPGRMVEPDEGFIDHPTPKPKTFISELVKMFSKEGDIVLDPFIGSGSTAMACKLTGRNYIGIELDKNYVELAEKRLKKFKPNQKLV